MVEGIVYTGYARNSRFYVKWWRTGTWNNSSSCGSNIRWELHLDNHNKWYLNALGTNTIEINGQQVYGSNKWSNYKTDGDFVLASGNLDVPHNNNGSKQITVKISGWFYQNGEKSGQQDFQLDSIARAPEFETQPYQLKADDEEIMKITYKPSKRITSVQYRIRMLGESWEFSDWENIEVVSGDWREGCVFKVQASFSSFDGSEVKNELQMRIMADNNGIWKESNIIVIQPVQKPNFINLKDEQVFKIGEPIKLEFKNPLNRTLELTIEKDEQTIKKYTLTGTSFTGLNEAEITEHFYKTSAKEKNTKVNYQISLYFKKGEYTIPSLFKNISFICNGSEKPIFQYFDFYDDNKDIVFWTGSQDVIIKGLSNLKARVTHENKMQTQKYATADHYKFSYGNIEKSIDANISGDIIVDFGIPTNSGNYKMTATAIDSRKMETSSSKEIKIYEYNKPILYIFGERKNLFEDETEINISGKISEILVNGTNKNAIQKIEYRYRADHGDFTPWKQLVVSSADAEFRLPKLFLNLDSEKSFDIEVQVTDNFKTTIEKLRIDSGMSIFSIRTDGNCYVGEDKVTTNNGTWGGKTPESDVENTTDAWVPVISGGKIQHRVISTDLNGRGTFEMNSASRHLDYNNKDRRRHLLTAESMAWWNGCWNQDQNGNYSNLEYCLQGRIQAKPTILFNNGDGQKGDITLSDNVNKYERVIIYYKDAETHANSSLVVSRSFNKYIILSILIPYPDLDIKVKVNKYLIKDNMLRLDNAKVTNLKENRNVRYDANDIAILKVEGYK